MATDATKLVLYFTTAFLLIERILSFLGRLYLHLRFQKDKEVQRELRHKYEGAYRNAGIVLLFDIFMTLAVVAIVILIAAVLYFIVA